MGTQQQTITATGAGTFIVPAGTTSLVIEAWGAGASGGGSSTLFASAGGAGGYSLAVVSVNIGQTVFYNVGAGPAGTSFAGTSGGVSWVNPSANSQPTQNGVVAAGGSGGDIAGTEPGGAGSVGTINFTGGSGGTIGAGGSGGGGGGAGSTGNGQNGANGTAGAGGAGGAGGSPDGGAGGAGVNIQPAGNGIQPGGGGGATGQSGVGGSGGNGQVRFTWTPVDTVLTNKHGKYFSRRDYAEWLDKIIDDRAGEQEEYDNLVREVEEERNLTDKERADRDFNSAEKEYGQSEEAMFKNLTTTNHDKFSEAKEKRNRARKERDHHYYMDVVKKEWAKYTAKGR